MMEALAIGVHRAIPDAVVAAEQTAAGTMAAEATPEVGTAEKTTAEEPTAMAESEAVADRLSARGRSFTSERTPQTVQAS
ncbi:MAG TPA: hypothetical protein VKP67_02315 [Xanthobacteraceae bacterium]|nr:hypothetical protein [Xanthobacteraceae bacterium]